MSDKKETKLELSRETVRDRLLSVLNESIYKIVPMVDDVIEKNIQGIIAAGLGINDRRPTGWELDRCNGYTGLVGKIIKETAHRGVGARAQAAVESFLKETDPSGRKKASRSIKKLVKEEYIRAYKKGIREQLKGFKKERRNEILDEQKREVKSIVEDVNVMLSNTRSFEKIAQQMINDRFEDYDE